MLPSHHLVTPFGSCTLVGSGQPSSILYPVLLSPERTTPSETSRESGPREHLKPFGPRPTGFPKSTESSSRLAARARRPTHERPALLSGAQPGRAHRATNNRRRSSPRPRAPDRRPSMSVAETSARLAPYLFRRGRPGAVPRLRSLGLPPGACRGVTRCAAPRA